MFGVTNDRIFDILGKAGLEWAFKNLTYPAQFSNNILSADKTKMNLYQNDEKGKVWIQRTSQSLSNMVETGAFVAAKGNGSLLFTDDVTAGRSSKMRCMRP